MRLINRSVYACFYELSCFAWDSFYGEDSFRSDFFLRLAPPCAISSSLVVCANEPVYVYCPRAIPCTAARQIGRTRFFSIFPYPDGSQISSWHHSRRYFRGRKGHVTILLLYELGETQRGCDPTAVVVCYWATVTRGNDIGQQFKRGINAYCPVGASLKMTWFSSVPPTDVINYRFSTSTHYLLRQNTFHERLWNGRFNDFYPCRCLVDGNTMTMMATIRQLCMNRRRARLWNIVRHYAFTPVSVMILELGRYYNMWDYHRTLTSHWKIIYWSEN